MQSNQMIMKTFYMIWKVYLSKKREIYVNKKISISIKTLLIKLTQGYMDLVNNRLGGCLMSVETAAVLPDIYVCKKEEDIAAPANLVF